MKKPDSVVSIVIAGIGGQGVITVSDILAETLFETGFEVKKSEIHGMSQRGGSVTSEIRFGNKVYSPIVPPGEADYLLIISEDQLERNRYMARPEGVIIAPDMIDQARLPNARSLNLALLGRLACYLKEIPESAWKKSIRRVMPAKLHATVLAAFAVGFKAAQEVN